MLQKIFRPICGVSALFSLLALLGTVGASEYNGISMPQTFMQATISLAAFGVFLKLAGAFDPYVKSGHGGKSQ